MRTLSISTALFLVVSACGLDVTTSPTREQALPLVSGEAVAGISLDPRDDVLHVLTDQRLLTVDKAGILVSEVNLAGLQPEFDAFRDVLALGDGSFALPHTAEVSRLYAEDGVVDSYFCLEPGFDPGPEPSEPDPVVVLNGRVNNSIAADFATDRIYAAPRVFADGEITDNKIVEYSISDGEFFRAVTLPADVRPDAMAFLEDGVLLAAQGASLFVLDVSGSTTTVRAEIDLEGVANISGIVVSDSEIIVAESDRATLTVYDAALLNGR